MATLFAKIGETTKIERIVDQFYQNVLSDERINHYWVEYISDIAQLHTNMAEYLT